MATMIAADVEPAVPFKIRPPQLVSRAYNAIVHRAERNLPKPAAEMSDNSEFRKRAQSGQSARVVVANGESSPESEQPLTPSSSAEQEQVQGQSMYEAQGKMAVINIGGPNKLYRRICFRAIGYSSFGQSSVQDRTEQKLSLAARGSRESQPLSEI
jgi:hypothetical protein